MYSKTPEEAADIEERVQVILARKRQEQSAIDSRPPIQETIRRAVTVRQDLVTSQPLVSELVTNPQSVGRRPISDAAFIRFKKRII